MRTMLLVKLKTAVAAAVVGCAVAVTTFTGWRADAAGGAEPAQPTAPKTPEALSRPKPDNEGRPAPKSDKERIAELERERAALLKKVAELEAHLRTIADSEERKFPQEAQKLTAAPEALQGAKPKPPVAPAAPAPTPGGLYDSNAVPAFPAQPPAPAAPYKKRTDPAAPRPGALATPAPDAPAGAPPAKSPPAAATPSVTLPESPAASGAKPLVRTYHVRTYPVTGLAADEKDGEALVKVVRAVVAPKSWGTDAGVEYLPSIKSLVVRQTETIHVEVKELLVQLEAQKKPPQNPIGNR